MSDFRNHSKNSLRSNSFSCRFACLAFIETRIEEDSENSTSSKDLLVRNVFYLVPSSFSVDRGLIGLRTLLPLLYFRGDNQPRGVLKKKVRAWIHSARRGLQRLSIFLNQYWVSDCEAIWATKYEMLSERSEFIEWFGKIDSRPLSQDVFMSLLFS